MSFKDKVIRWAIVRWLEGQVKENTVIGKIWAALDGKKTIFGAVIAVVSYLAAGVPLVSPLCGENAACVAHVATVGGVLLFIVGVLHKAYKFIYKTDAPSQ